MEPGAWIAFPFSSVVPASCHAPLIARVSHFLRETPLKRIFPFFLSRAYFLFLSLPRAYSFSLALSFYFCACCFTTYVFSFARFPLSAPAAVLRTAPGYSYLLYTLRSPPCVEYSRPYHCSRPKRHFLCLGRPGHTPNGSYSDRPDPPYRKSHEDIRGICVIRAW